MKDLDSIAEKLVVKMIYYNKNANIHG